MKTASIWHFSMSDFVSPQLLFIVITYLALSLIYLPHLFHFFENYEMIIN